MNRTILHGDVLEKLKEIETESIDCIITSPPYWGLRDYGVDGQLGLESDFRQYLEKMAIIMEELKRVLKKTGTCWINLGDTYGLDNGKSRYGIPERFYTNCIDAGWIARNHIPWYKSNSMPSSVKDRFSNKWESIFFFAKNQKYYFNLDAVRERAVTGIRPSFNVRVRDAKTGKLEQKYGGKYQASLSEIENYGESYTGKQKKQDSTLTPFYKDQQKIFGTNRGNTGLLKQDNTLDATGKPNPTYKGFNERWYDNPATNGKNPGDIFFINPKPFPESHFATFPVELPERILRCACPENGIVLDPFFGAGTVGVAAEKLNRQWVGIELNEEYISIAQKRLDRFSNSKLEDWVDGP